MASHSSRMFALAVILGIIRTSAAVASPERSLPEKLKEGFLKVYAPVDQIKFTHPDALSLYVNSYGKSNNTFDPDDPCGTGKPGLDGWETTVKDVFTYILAVTMAFVAFTFGCGTDFMLLKEAFTKPVGLVIGCLCQFIIMPALAYVLSIAVNMPEYPKLSTLIMGSCPGGSLSNVTTFWVGGSLTLSIAMSTVSSVAAMGVLPLLMFIYSQGFSVSIGVPFDEIAIIIVSLTVPIGLGMLCKWKKPEWAMKVKNIGGVIGLISNIISASVLCGIFAKTWVIIWQFFVVTALMPFLGCLIGYTISRLTAFIPPIAQTEANCRAIAIETGVQNTQLAVAIINIAPTFSRMPCIQAEMAVMPLLYLCVQTIWAFILIGSCVLYRKYHPEKVHEELKKNIEIAEADDESVISFEKAVARRKSMAALRFVEPEGGKPSETSDGRKRSLKIQNRRGTIFDAFNRGLVTSTLAGVGGAYVPVVEPEVEEEIAKNAMMGTITDPNGNRRTSIYHVYSKPVDSDEDESEDSSEQNL